MPLSSHPATFASARADVGGATLVRDAFGGGASEFSVALSAFGIGGIVGAIGLLTISATHDRRVIATGFGIIYGGVLILSGLNPSLALVPVLLAAAGAAMNVTSTAANTVLQSSSPAELLGRAVSLHMMAVRGGISVGTLLTGVMISYIDIRTGLVINGSLAVVMHFAIWRTWPHDLGRK